MFLLALPEKQTEEGFERTGGSLEQVSEYDRKLFTFFIVFLEAQIKSLKLTEAQLSGVLKERLQRFDAGIKTIRQKHRI